MPIFVPVMVFFWMVPVFDLVNIQIPLPPAFVIVLFAIKETREELPMEIAFLLQLVRVFPFIFFRTDFLAMVILQLVNVLLSIRLQVDLVIQIPDLLPPIIMFFWIVVTVALSNKLIPINLFWFKVLFAIRVTFAPSPMERAFFPLLFSVLPEMVVTAALFVRMMELHPDEPVTILFVILVQAALDR